ncbi:DNA-deoxyinosine glycosylase [Campylobacter sp. MIT 21-1685]|uniref:DNA-deoxyinosine glycosylase n=1 Tax=unclassified Campylobacter TaxID=2593542 RepID=UPI00224B30E1|nr:MULTISPECIES: DNA-deoxyinosine glycosylase [unclassified Campylobacter]MCX2682517.1 DNA-deoxyinosine glycosylase [Campylobacter sp. MIT 21-1684]MCX2750770.1 DNA-deoxyinosine glycosylase [Campylobacter sp. MIT 21-1682]MCX2806998.1 DNA-deoxyinosine glycosylase [Campylobacter sp. MIT 21-1685]
MNQRYYSFEPFFDANSLVLILGSFPSVKSRQFGFYYQHPRNRFWRILEKLYGVKLEDISSQKQFLKQEKIALWDIIASCKIKNSDDKTISYAKANNLHDFLPQTQIKQIFTTGRYAFHFFKKFYPNLQALALPSSSPANLHFSFENLVEAYSIIKETTQFFSNKKDLYNKF